MYRHMPWVGALSLAAFMSITSSASAQLALSANDGKAVLIDGVNSVPTNPSADSVAVIDLNATPPKVVAEIQAPASVVGPPLSVAVARDESFALVTGATKLDPRSEEHTSELQSRGHLVCRLLLEKKKTTRRSTHRSSTKTKSNTNI